MSIVTGASIVNNISKGHVEITKQNINTILREILTEVKSQLAQGNSVSFHDFGIFAPKTLAAREGTSFGKAYSTPERKSVSFKLSASFKEILNPAD